MTWTMLKPLYLAGPISGLTYEDAVADRHSWEAKQEFKLVGFQGISPLEGYEELAGQGTLPVMFEEIIEGSAEQAVHADLRMIDASVAVFANFTRESGPSLGTAAELGYAFAQGKPIVTLMPDDSVANQHPFVLYLSSHVETTWNEAMAKLAAVRESLETLPYA